MDKISQISLAFTLMLSAENIMYVTVCIYIDSAKDHQHCYQISLICKLYNFGKSGCGAAHHRITYDTTQRAQKHPKIIEREILRPSTSTAMLCSHMNVTSI